MRRLEYNITAAEHGMTVQQVLSANGIPKRLLVRLKQTEDGLTVGGERVRSTRVLSAGETLCVVLPQQTGPCRTDCGIPILFCDEDIMVCSKPAGIPCHRSGGHIHDTLEDIIGEKPLRVMGRLDKDTSGVLLLARNQLAASRLHGHIAKQYIAVAGGTPLQSEGDIDLPLTRYAAYEPLQVVDPDGQPARTRYRVLAAEDGVSLLLCTPVTGRMHQIRAHLAAIGAPLLGDALYGGRCGDIGRHALHCCRIEFLHPFSQEKCRFASPVPDDMRRLLSPAMREALLQYEKQEF